MIPFAAARRNMVDCQLRTFEVTDRAVLAAMEVVPREAFVPEGFEERAYLDQHLVVGPPDDPRVLLSPMTLARLVQALDIETGSRVLDVGGGLGCSAAVLARLGAHVVMLEPRGDLSEGLARRLAEAGVQDGVTVVSGPLTDGAPQHAPFDAILINGAVEVRPEVLLPQLAEGGQLACVHMKGSGGQACVYVRAGDAFGSRRLFDVAAPFLAAFRKAPGFVF